MDDSEANSRSGKFFKGILAASGTLAAVIGTAVAVLTYLDRLHPQADAHIAAGDAGSIGAAKAPNPLAYAAPVDQAGARAAKAASPASAATDLIAFALDPIPLKAGVPANNGVFVASTTAELEITNTSANLLYAALLSPRYSVSLQLPEGTTLGVDDRRIKGLAGCASADGAKCWERYRNNFTPIASGQTITAAIPLWRYAPSADRAALAKVTSAKLLGDLYLVEDGTGAQHKTSISLPGVVRNFVAP